MRAADRTLIVTREQPLRATAGQRCPTGGPGTHREPRPDRSTPREHMQPCRGHVCHAERGRDAPQRGARVERHVLPMLGRLVANDEGSYRYLAESIRKHPDQETLLGMMKTAGFDQCRYHNLSGGIVALHRGYKV